MPTRRTLSLKREVLQELSAADLQVVAGGTKTVAQDTTKAAETLYSCLAFVSCAIPFCLLRDSDKVCLETG